MDSKEDMAKRMAALSQEPQIYVVPDNQMPGYGEEVPRLSTEQNLQAFTSAIQGQQAKNPVYMPFAPGTPTLQKQGLDEEKRQFDMTFPLKQAEMEYSISKPYFAPKSPAAPKAPTATQIKQLQQQESEDYMKTHMSKFKRPIDFVEQARRNYEAGTIPSHVFESIKDYMEANYDPYHTFERWKK